VTGQIRDSIQRLGFKISDIKYILNTQAHLDHTGGFAALKKESGAQLIVGARDKPLIEGGYYPGQESTAELKFPPATVDRAVKDGDTVSLGGLTITAHDTPGHTPGCTSWSLNVKDGNDTRSVIIFCSATIALNKLVGNPTYPGIIDDYRKTFAWARTFKADVFLAPKCTGWRQSAKKSRRAAPTRSSTRVPSTPTSPGWRRPSMKASPNKPPKPRRRNSQRQGACGDVAALAAGPLLRRSRGQPAAGLARKLLCQIRPRPLTTGALTTLPVASERNRRRLH
jgi:hypothetical protein